LKELLYKNIYFDAGPDFVEPCNPALNSKAGLKLLVNKKIALLINEIAVRTTCDNEEHLVTMTKETAARGEFVVFKAKIPILVKTSGVRFKIYSKNCIYWLNARGLYSYHPNDYFDFKIIAGNDSPAWVNKSVFYQIFPDRFWHGLSQREYGAGRDKLKMKFKKLYAQREIHFKGIEPEVKLWNELPDKKALGFEFYMGTLAGIAQKKEYLNELGVNALYLTPILKSPSNHRYDTSDYFSVDPLLGGNAGFKKFMDAMRGSGFRVILDAVYNHSGSSCDIFKKALNRIKPFDEFYNFYGDNREHYARWLGHGSLPKLNYASEKLCDYIFKGPKSAAAKWLREPYKIDGYRLDVAHMIGKNACAEGNAEILSRMKESFKKFSPEVFVLAENFFDTYKMIENDSVDSIMNYHGFTYPVMAYLSKKDLKKRPCAIDSLDFCDWVLDCYAKLPQVKANVMYNQLSSHDISRHNSLLNFNYKKIAAALVFQFTLPGVPSIFYGDEIGLGGIGDPGCRAPMIWDERRQNKSLFAAYKKLTAARKKYDALAYGGFRVIKSADDIICYIRKYRDETILCALNNSSQNSSIELQTSELFITGAITRCEVIFDSLEFDSEASVNKRGLRAHKNSREGNGVNTAADILKLTAVKQSSAIYYIKED
jgi:alpha-glucosidase